MRFAYRGVFVVFVACSVPALQAIAAMEQQGLQQRFVSEAPHCWAKMREVVGTLECVAVETRTRRPRGKAPITRKRRISYYLEGKLQKVLVEDVPDDNARLAVAANAGYTFEADRDTSHRAYYLGDYGREGHDRARIEQHMQHYIAFLCAAETIDEWWARA